MLHFIIIFSLCSLINVMFSTMKTIIMYRNNKFSSSLANAISYGFYTVIVVLMAGDMPLLLKIVIVSVTNFVGVWISMIILDKFRKDRLWKVEVTIPNEYVFEVKKDIRDISYSMIKIDNKYTLFNFYCPTQTDSLKVKEIVNKYHAKYFVSESKIL